MDRFSSSFLYPGMVADILVMIHQALSIYHANSNTRSSHYLRMYLAHLIVCPLKANMLMIEMSRSYRTLA